MILPLARTKEIILQSSGKDLLVYDLRTNKAHCLNETARIVFDNCDGTATFEDLKISHNFTDDLIYLALDQLKECKLINESYSAHFGGINRRDAVRKAGLTALIALPAVSSLVAPASVSAQSCLAPGAVTDLPPQATLPLCSQAAFAFLSNNCCNAVSPTSTLTYDSPTGACSATC